MSDVERERAASLDTIDRMIKDLPLNVMSPREIARLEQILESADDAIAAEVYARLDAKM